MADTFFCHFPSGDVVANGTLKGTILSFSSKVEKMSTLHLSFRRQSGVRAFSGSRRRTGAAGRSSTSTGSPRPGTA